MIRILGALFGIAVLLGVCWLAEQKLDDRHTTVSPADATAENFIRQVITGRYVRAEAQMADHDSLRLSEIRALDQMIEERFGEVSTVQARIHDESKSEALVTLYLTSGSGEAVLTAPLEWQRGGWKIGEVPTLVE